MMANDRIVEIEGRSTMGKSTEECIDMLKGEPGSQVSFVIERDGERIPFSVTRERIIARTVKGFHWNEKPANGGEWQYFIDPDRRIAYLRLTQFAPTSAAEVAQALEVMGAARGEVRGLILDLRWNPGGVLDDAVEIADLFLTDQVIVSTRGRSRPDEVARARPDGTLPDFPVTILLNNASASASEVLAGALAENDRAVIVGTRSFGKGLVQGVHTISPGGGQLKLTEQRYYLPSGRCIQRTDDAAEWGVDPTDGFYVPMTDEQTREMLRVLREQMVVGNGRADSEQDRWSDPTWILDRLRDPQLAAAVRAIQGKIDSGAWTPTGQPLPKTEAFVSEELARVTSMRDRLERELIRLQQRIEAMETVAPTVPIVDLWPDDVEIVGGMIQVYDRQGRPVTRLKVSDADIERSLIDAGLRNAGE
jgi:carboxyl-terminal processing protease